MSFDPIAEKKKKLSTHYKVKGERQNAIKAVNSDERTVYFMANTFYYVDSDGDITIPGCFQKSIQDRGPQSKAHAKIKHFLHHDPHKIVGRVDVLRESNEEGFYGLYCESYLPETTDGEDTLCKYDEKLYDNHSIGFRYEDLEYVEKDSDGWNTYYPLLLNPEEADNLGYFWVIKQARLFEVSTVSFGANELTPVLGSKANGEPNPYYVQEQVDKLVELMTKGNLNQEEKEAAKIKADQIKQLISEQTSVKPGLKGTEKPPLPPTPKKKEPELNKSNFINSILT